MVRGPWLCELGEDLHNICTRGPVENGRSAKCAKWLSYLKNEGRRREKVTRDMSKMVFCSVSTLLSLAKSNLKPHEMIVIDKRKLMLTHPSRLSSKYEYCSMVYHPSEFSSLNFVY